MTTIDTPVGPVHIAADEAGVRAIRIGGAAPQTQTNAVATEAAKQLRAYFDGRLRVFDLPLAPVGTAFQLKVWEALRSIPFGTTATYGQIAAVVGAPRAARAIGNANNRNPIAIVVPCHRVVGASGALTGYAAGLDIKAALLDLERGAT
jgi:methylated-DNA-[protein]-cysteine S-methyltransferase